jgi:hypothetical protein
MEALMLLRATAPARWSALEVAQRLYVTPTVAAAVLADLDLAGMLASQADDSVYIYAPRSNALAGVVQQLSSFYSSHLVEMTVLIHSRLDRKAQQFADAFDFRKDS